MTFQNFPLQLTACAEDVVSAILSNECRGAVADKDLLETQNGIVPRPLVGGSVQPGLKDEIHLHAHAAHEARERLGIFERVEMAPARARNFLYRP